MKKRLSFTMIAALVIGTVPSIAFNNNLEKPTYFGFEGWGRKQAITILAGQVAGTTDLVDFPVLITLDHLDSEIVDGGSNSALNGGGDIRFSSDAEGNNPLAIDVVEFVVSATPANRKCQIWVKVPNLSASVHTMIYIWYNKTGEVQPAADSTYGSQAVWSNYRAIWHLEEDPSASAPQVFDSTSNDNDGTTMSTMASNDTELGKIGNAIRFDGAGERINMGNDQSLNLTSNLTLSGWFNPTSLQDVYVMAKRNETVSEGYNIFLLDENRIDFNNQGNNSLTGTSYSANQWNYAVIRLDSLGTSVKGFMNGNFSPVRTTSQLPDGLAQNLYLAGRGGSTSFTIGGALDEIRVSSGYLSDEWLLTEYNNQGSPSTFALAGTPVSTSGGGSISSVWTEIDDVASYGGGVAVGTTTVPTGYKMSVDGKLLTEEIKVQLSDTWPDYVFDKNYDLPSLEEVRKHIEDKGHLPHIPSAKEVKANGGVELGEMNRLLLQKIEEMTLYIIQIHEKLSEQEKKNAWLEIELERLQEPKERLKN